MAQPFRQTVLPGSAGFISPELGGLCCSVAYRETAGHACTVTLEGPDGDSLDVVSANGQGLVRSKRLNKIIITGNGASVVVDARPEPEWIDPQYLTATVQGTVTTDIGTTNPNPLALESGGNLAAAVADLATIVSKLTNIITNLPQVSTSHGTVLAVHDQGA